MTANKSTVSITGISVADDTVTVTWEGASGGAQLQRISDLGSGQWENVGTATTDGQATDAVTGAAMFYRVQH